MSADVEMRPIDVQEVSRIEPEKKPSKASIRNQKRKAAREAKKALNPKKPSKANLEPRLPSSIVFPENAIDKTLEGEQLLAEIKKRISEKNSQTVRVRPVSKKCSHPLLQSLCPTSIAVRIPSKKNCRYAFVEFKTALEAKTIANELNGRIFDGKAIEAIVCSESPSDVDNWKSLEERRLEDFDLSSLFISNLPRFADRSDLAQIFRTADTINFMNMPDGNCKGFCILRYRNRAEALKAFLSRHGTLYRGIPIFVNFTIKSKSRTCAKKRDESIAKDADIKFTSKPADQKEKEQSLFVKEAENVNCKRKASGDDEEVSTEVGLPTKRRGLENEGEGEGEGEGAKERCKW
nr:nAChR subunit (ShAR1 beta2) [Hymenolepis microstoma]